MSLAEKIAQDTNEAMRRKEQRKVLALRSLRASIKNAEIELKKKDEGLSDDEVIGVISREVKKTKESIELFEGGGREDLAADSRAELEVLMSYLPPQMPEDEIRRVVRAAVEQTAAQGPGDLGKVMKAVMPALKGKADGSVINKIVREELGAS